jgi:hypothetical protein
MFLVARHDLYSGHAVDHMEMAGHGSPSRQLNYSVDPSVIDPFLAAMAMMDNSVSSLLIAACL